MALSSFFNSLLPPLSDCRNTQLATKPGLAFLYRIFVRNQKDGFSIDQMPQLPASKYGN